MNDEPDIKTSRGPSFKEAFLFWLKLGFVSFGGPAGQIAIMHEFLVEKKKWISESKFLHALNYCMLLPGPEAQQLATYSGWLLHGTRGGLAAGILFVLPSVFILLALSIAYALYGNVPWVSAMFSGLKPAVVAIVIVALIRIGKRSLKGFLPVLFAAASFAALFFFDVPFPIIILSVILLAILLNRFAPSVMSSRNESKYKDYNERDYFINNETQLPHTRFNGSKLTFQAVAALVLWGIPFIILMIFASGAAFWKALVLFFTKAALVTFGGAYAVLPYVAQVSVEKHEWLTGLQMIDGLALGETTPGPLIMVLAFVGFMAGFNHYGGSLLHGTAGLFLTVYYTFLPCFLFIFAGAPVIERTLEHQKIRAVLNLVTAAVVGVMLNLTIYFAVAVVFPFGNGMIPEWSNITLSPHQYFTMAFNVGWIIISFVALYRFKVNMILWIALSALAGLSLHFITAS